jgi:murein hydrolase activator
MASHCSRTTVLLVGLLLTGAASAQTPSSDKARADAAAARAAERIRALQRESDALALQEKSILVELRKYEVERELRAADATRAEQALRTTRDGLAATIARAESLRSRADSERPDVEARLVRLYKLGRAGYWRLLLDVNDVRAMGRAYRTAAAMTRLDRERVQQHQKTIEALVRERKTLETRVREIAKLQEQAARARSAAERAVKARTALVDAIDAHRDLNAQLTGELQAAQERLQSAVGQLGSGRAISLPLRPFRGALPWPLQGIVVGPFGRQQGNAFGGGLVRNGIEISAAEGQPVRAVHEGMVAFAEPFTGYGNLVIVDHGDGAYSLYGHLTSLDVAKGDRADAQAQVGMSGRNPAGNPALYFELRVDGKPVDPLQWLKK